VAVVAAPAREPSVAERQFEGIWQLIAAIEDGKHSVHTTCVAEPGKDHPTEFAAKPGTGKTLRVFKRAKS
jgi:hypothetical protein